METATDYERPKVVSLCAKEESTLARGGSATHFQSGKPENPRVRILEMLGLAEEELLKFRYLCRQRKLAPLVMVREIVKDAVTQKVRIDLGS